MFELPVHNVHLLGNHNIELNKICLYQPPTTIKNTQQTETIIFTGILIGDTWGLAPTSRRHLEV